MFSDYVISEVDAKYYITLGYFKPRSTESGRTGFRTGLDIIKVHEDEHRSLKYGHEPRDLSELTRGRR